MSTQPHSPIIYLQPTTPSHKMYKKISKKKSLHSESILQLVANLTQNHCSPWKKCNLIGPKNDSTANRNIEMQTLISDITYL